MQPAPPAANGHEPLDERIRREIEARGPIPFSRFMELALYEPGLGYYERVSGPGPQGDYLTGPTIHRAFSVLMASQLEQMWRHLGRPSTFWLIEAGPGNGTFARDVLSAAAAGDRSWSSALHVALIERSAQLRRRQQAVLSSWTNQVAWLGAESPTWRPLGVGCVFANELLDAMPVHRIVRKPDGPREVYVDHVDGHLADFEDSPSTPDLVRQLAEGHATLRVGQRAEVNLAAPTWVVAASGLISAGYVMLVDYGAPATDLYGDRFPDGTLRCFWRHTMNRLPYARVGQQDITAHVDFSAVTRAAEGAGLRLEGATTQQKLLNRLGLPLLRERVEGSVPGRTAQRAHRTAMALLANPHGLGGALAIAYAKNTPGRPLAGFARTTPADPPLPPTLWTLPGAADEPALIRSGAR
jgi:SAM-dependent MidA family methyltransferase